VTESSDTPQNDLVNPASEDSTGEDWVLEAETPESQVTRALMKELVRLRKRKKIAQEPLAKAIGLTQGRLSQIEHSKGGSMSLEAFILYAKTIGAQVVLQPDDEDDR